MGGEGRHQRDAAFFSQFPVLAVVHSVRGHHGDPAVAMHGVVPAEERPAVDPRMLDRREARREVRSILERLELRLRVRIVIGDVWPAVRLDHIEVHEERGHRLGPHARTAIRVQRQGPRRDTLLVHRVGDELLGELGGFTRGDHPADDVAAEDIEDDVQVKARPFGRPLEWSERPGVVELFPGLSAPNRTCTFQRIRLSISSVAHSKDKICVTRFKDTALLFAQDVRVAIRQPPFELTLPARHQSPQRDFSEGSATIRTR